jgi:hypothetical protein
VACGTHLQHRDHGWVGIQTRSHLEVRGSKVKNEQSQTNKGNLTNGLILTYSTKVQLASSYCIYRLDQISHTRPQKRPWTVPHWVIVIRVMELV